MLNERKLTERELDKRAEAIQGLLSNKRTLVKKYGKEAEKVMYGIATKQAKSKVEGMNKNKIKELIQQALMGEQGPATNTEPYHDQQTTVDTGFSGRADYGEEDKALGDEDELEMKGFEENVDEISDTSVFDFANPTGGPTLDPYPRKVGKSTGKSYINRPSGPAKFPEGIEEAEGSTINLSQSDMDKLHSSGKLDLDGHKLVYKANEVKEDLDIGHQDDEPGMLKKELARAGQMIQMLYRAVDKYDDQGEVDFPQWWQAKIIKANAMLDSAFDYLDGEEMVAKIDAMIDSADKIEIIDVVNEEEFKKRMEAEKAIRQTLKDEGGAAGLEPLVKAVKKLGFNKEELVKLLKKVVRVKKHRDGDYILIPLEERVSFDDILDLRADKADLNKRISQLYRDMEQEAEPEGGPIADRYGDEIEKLEAKLYRVMKQINDYDMNESTNPNDKGDSIPGMFAYLDLIRKAGKDFMNKGYIMKEFGLDSGEARSVLGKYTSQFEEYEDVEISEIDKKKKEIKEETFEDEIERLEKIMYVDRRDKGRIFIHPLDKPGVIRPSNDYIAIDGNNVTSIQGYNLGPISDLADIYNLDDEDSQLTPMGKTNVSGRVSLLSSNILRDAIKAIKDSRDIESKRQSDYYKDRGSVSGIGNMDEMIKSIVKEKLTKKSSVEDHIDDFKDSDAKQFKGKSLDKIKKMALASFLSKQKK